MTGLALAAWLAAAPARAQAVSTAPAPGGSTDLAQCYGWALLQSEALHMQSEQIEQLEQQYRQAVGSALPNLSLAGSEKWEQIPPGQGGGFFFQSPAPQVNLVLSQPLFTGLREFAEMHSLKHQGAALGLQRKRAEKLLYATVASAFYLTLNLESQLANTRTAVDLTTARVRELKRFEELGKSRHSEVTLVESQEASLEAEAAGLKGQIDVARNVLSFVTGRDMAQTRLVDRLERFRALAGEESALDRAYARSDVLALREQLGSQDDQVRLAQGAYWPVVGFVGDYYLKRLPFLEGVRWDATLSASLPIFSGGSQVAAVRQARAARLEAEYAYQLGVRQARSDIHAAYATLDAAVSGADAAERAAAKADETYRLETKEYRLGLVNNLDVLTALNSFISAKTVFDQLVVQMKLDWIQLKVADEELP